MTLNFSDFLPEVTAAYKLKIDLHRFFGKNILLRFLVWKGPKAMFFRKYSVQNFSDFLLEAAVP